MVAFTFISISIIEYVGVIISMLALFRYPVLYYVPQIVFTSVICSYLSYVLSVENSISIAPLLQLLVMALCIWLMFNTPLIWSFIMCGPYLVAYALFQGGIIYMLYWLKVFSADVTNTSMEMYAVQLLSAVFCILLGIYWIRKRIGFLFVPTSRDERFVWSNNGIRLFVGSVISFIAFGTVFELYPQTGFQWFHVLLGGLLVVSGCLLFILKRKNSEYVEKTWTR